jgi:protein MpaA
MRLGSILAFLLLFPVGCQAKDHPGAQPPNAKDGQIPWGNVSPLSENEIHKRLGNLCDRLNKKFKEYRWGNLSCDPSQWHVGGLSQRGEPLIYSVFGDHSGVGARDSLMMCGVHGDESTAVHMCFSLAAMMRANPAELKGHRLVVAPLVNPDGFFAKTRTNAHGVDLNRNFATKDWEVNALKEWKSKYGSDKRKFPGKSANSEPETLFQVWLMDQFRPHKILSAHAPLRFIDYDGPADRKHYNLERKENRARFLAMNISKNSHSPLVDYQFFPGSLGNYAGQENSVPTYTIELSTSDPAQAEALWKRFEYALVKAVRFDVDDNVVLSNQPED